jgi:hypothetical protein
VSALLALFVSFQPPSTPELENRRENICSHNESDPMPVARDKSAKRKIGRLAIWGSADIRNQACASTDGAAK